MSKIDKREFIVSATKSIFGAIPFGGALLDELFFEYNGRIKQKRLNDFIEILAENFTKESGINLDNIKTEDFNDLFESVLRRVVQTQSELKLKRFKDILIGELISPTEQIELVELYLDLITTLSEEELSILFHHRFFDNKYEDEIDKLNKLKDKINSIKEKQKREKIIIGRSEYADEELETKKEILKIENWLKPLQEYKKAEFYSLNDNKFMFFKQRLFSKGLLMDNVRNRINGGTFQNMGITEFGTEFIEFIKRSEL